MAQGQREIKGRPCLLDTEQASEVEDFHEEEFRVTLFLCKDFQDMDDRTTTCLAKLVVGPQNQISRESPELGISTGKRAVAMNGVDVRTLGLGRTRPCSH